MTFSALLWLVVGHRLGSKISEAFSNPDDSVVAGFSGETGTKVLQVSEMLRNITKKSNIIALLTRRVTPTSPSCACGACE